jgi:hypothetical protein
MSLTILVDVLPLMLTNWMDHLPVLPAPSRWSLQRASQHGNLNQLLHTKMNINRIKIQLTCSWPAVGLSPILHLLPPHHRLPHCRPPREPPTPREPPPPPEPPALHEPPAPCEPPHPHHAAPQEAAPIAAKSQLCPTSKNIRPVK